MRKIYCEITSRELDLPEHLERIVSLSPAVTETLFMLGLGERVVGVSAFDVHPEEARKKPILGSYSTTNMEKLRSLKPELIFLTSGYQRGLATKLSELYPTYVVELPVSVSSIVDMAVKVGLVVNEPEKARVLAKKMITTLAQHTRNTQKPKRVYIEVDLGGAVTFGAYSYITDALSVVGARNIFADHACEWEAPNFNTVVERDPEVIIYEPKMFRPKTPSQVLDILNARGWLKLTALREGRVHTTPAPYDFLAHHGPSFILEAVPWLDRTINYDTDSV
ncbi:MAG: ABC transporter substrate-binding protein [Thermoprotei archaeon]